MAVLPLVYLVRHGATSWSATGRHTGRSDIPLSPEGENQARAVGRLLEGIPFASVRCSPLSRTRRTVELAGIHPEPVIDPDVTEWDYGSYEGLTTRDIRARVPGWTPFVDGAPGGESPEEVDRRVRRVLAQLQGRPGPQLVVSHAHFLRCLAVAWIGLPISHGRLLVLEPGSVSLLGWEHDAPDEPVVRRWNHVPLRVT